MVTVILLPHVRVHYHGSHKLPTYANKILLHVMPAEESGGQINLVRASTVSVKGDLSSGRGNEGGGCNVGNKAYVLTQTHTHSLMPTALPHTIRLYNLRGSAVMIKWKEDRIKVSVKWK